ncbi:hypothetical protein LY76DRAFT_64239 [Colletotrichum caudatum]|nr:hypothetical protein LY76DRAFT_64239 [Colletotrichum caudatum]
MPARPVKSRNKTVRDTPEVPSELGANHLAARVRCGLFPKGFIRTARNDVHYSACLTSDARSRLPEVEQLNSTCSLVWGSDPSTDPSASNSSHFGKDRTRCSTLQFLLGKASGWRTHFTLQHVRSQSTVAEYATSRLGLFGLRKGLSTKRSREIDIHA